MMITRQLKLLAVLMPILAVLVLGIRYVNALTPAGVIINNQATATYTDSNSTLQSTSSNLVQTLVQEVIGALITENLTKNVVDDATFYFPHFLTNIGNGPEGFTVCLDQSPFNPVPPPPPFNPVIGDGINDFNFDTLRLFADADQDGIPDSGTPYPFAPTPAPVSSPTDLCYQVPPLNGGEAVQLVVAAVLSDRGGALLPDYAAQYSIAAYADSDPAVSDSDTDTGIYTDEPIVEVVKSMSANQGVSPSGPYTITLTYRNIGATDAQNLEITEILPTDTFPTPLRGVGMTYVTGSAQWSHNSAATVNLTDNSLVAQTSGTANGTYCAYDAACTPSPTTPYGTDRAAIVIDSVAAGETGTLTFEFDVASGLFDSDVLRNIVQYNYENTSGTAIPGPLDTDTLDSNAVTFVIINAVTAPGVVANSSDTDSALGVDDSLDTDNIVSVASIEQGNSVTFNNYIWNTGDGLDTFDITLDNVLDRQGSPMATPFPVGTVYELLQSDGVSPLLDSNTNSTPDTGPVNPGESYLVVLRVTPPAGLSGDNSGNGWDVTKIATSAANTGITNAVTDRLLLITESTIDLTNSQTYDTDCLNVVSGAATPGDGGCTDYQGEGYPNGELTPVNTFNVGTGESILIPLWSHNVGAAQDNFDLSFSSTNFNAGVIPAGWQVKFFEPTSGTDCSSTGDRVTSTGIINGGSNLLACAEVSIDEDIVADGVPQSLFFRVLSPTTGRFDIKHEQIIVTQNPLIGIIPDHFGQGRPGQFISYPHTIDNHGNTNLECINVTLNDSLSADGWVSVVYLDVDEDQQISNGDIPLTDQTLAPGEEFKVIVRVFIPATAIESAINITTVTATGHVDDNDADPNTCTGAVLSDEANDKTMVTLTDIVITKQQAPDVDCDGLPDSAFTFAEFQVAPLECVTYLLTATNVGTEQMLNLVVDDDTPPFTTYLPAAETCAVVGGTPASCTPPTTQPGLGGKGVINWSINTLEAGGKIEATFGVEIEE